MAQQRIPEARVGTFTEIMDQINLAVTHEEQEYAGAARSLELLQQTANRLANEQDILTKYGTAGAEIVAISQGLRGRVRLNEGRKTLTLANGVIVNIEKDLGWLQTVQGHMRNHAAEDRKLREGLALTFGEIPILTFKARVTLADITENVKNIDTRRKTFEPQGITDSDFAKLQFFVQKTWSTLDALHELNEQASGDLCSVTGATDILEAVVAQLEPRIRQYREMFEQQVGIRKFDISVFSGENLEHEKRLWKTALTSDVAFAQINVRIHALLRDLIVGIHQVLQVTQPRARPNAAPQGVQIHGSTAATPQQTNNPAQIEDYREHIREAVLALYSMFAIQVMHKLDTANALRNAHIKIIQEIEREAGEMIAHTPIDLTAATKAMRDAIR